MKAILHLISSCAMLLVAASTIVFSPLPAMAQSGEVGLGNSVIEPAFDDTTGAKIFYLETNKTPSPVKANSHAIAPLYAVVYPVGSSIPADELNCQPTNCDHLGVLPFPDADYGVLAGSDPACQGLNGGQPCSPVKGHDHLIGIASTGGDFNVPWQVELVLFTSKAFADGTINIPVTTVSDLQTLVNNGEVFIVETPITFNCSVVSEHTYDNGTPLVVPYP